MRVGCKSLYRNGIALQDPLPRGNFFSVTGECDWRITWMFLNPSVVIHMEWQQKNSFRGNQPKVMRVPWLGLFISKRYNSASWTLQDLTTIQQLSTTYSATLKPDQSGLLLFGLLLYLELNCCEQISQKKDHNQSPDTAKLLNNAVACSSVANGRKMEIKMAAAEEKFTLQPFYTVIFERKLQVQLMRYDALEEDGLDLQEALNVLFSHKYSHLPW